MVFTGEFTMIATNFEEFIHKMAQEAPHSVVLDWYRRLDLAVRDYRKAMKGQREPRNTSKSLIARDALLGRNVANEIAALRATRNEVAHTGIAVSADEAVAYARQCFALIGVVGRAQDARTA
jgi:hypothetical protein